MPPTHPKTRAFTLLELIVVIVVLGVLAAIAIPTFQAVIQKSSDEATLTSLRAMAREAQALEAFDQNGWDNTDVEAAASDTTAAAPGIYAARLKATKDAGKDPIKGEVMYVISGEGLALSQLSDSGRVCTVGANYSTVEKGTCGPSVATGTESTLQVRLADPAVKTYPTGTKTDGTAAVAGIRDTATIPAEHRNYIDQFVAYALTKSPNGGTTLDTGPMTTEYWSAQDATTDVGYWNSVVGADYITYPDRVRTAADVYCVSAYVAPLSWSSYTVYSYFSSAAIPNNLDNPHGAAGWYPGNCGGQLLHVPTPTQAELEAAATQIANELNSTTTFHVTGSTISLETRKYNADGSYTWVDVAGNTYYRLNNVNQTLENSLKAKAPAGSQFMGATVGSPTEWIVVRNKADLTEGWTGYCFHLADVDQYGNTMHGHSLIGYRSVATANGPAGIFYTDGRDGSTKIC